jgi:CBS domain containing-hemolysin-like protein
MHTSGRIPGRKESINYKDVTFTIENADQKSIKEILVVFPAPAEREAIKK